jgi:hypothetical protein
MKNCANVDENCLGVILATIYCHHEHFSTMKFLIQGFFLVKGPAADVTDAPQPWDLLCNPMRKMISIFFVFSCNGATVEWQWQEKTETLWEKPLPVPLCQPQIPHGLTRNRTLASAVKGRLLNAWVVGHWEEDPSRKLRTAEYAQIFWTVSPKY